MVSRNYRDGVDFKVQVERGPIEQLLRVPNRGTSRGSLIVHKVTLLTGGIQEHSLATNDHPQELEGELIVSRIKRTLVERNGIFSPEDIAEPTREERISVLGSYNPTVPFSPDIVGEGNQINFSLAALNIYSPRPRSQMLTGILGFIVFSEE
jgi:hypothetical protein